jgi:hypothetical protein
MSQMARFVKRAVFNLMKIFHYTTVPSADFLNVKCPVSLHSQFYATSFILNVQIYFISF